jgi:hypothetical protein
LSTVFIRGSNPFESLLPGSIEALIQHLSFNIHHFFTHHAHLLIFRFRPPHPASFKKI